MYSALLVAPDGDWTVDFHCESIVEVEEELGNMGSRWFFYPFHAVICDHTVTRPSNRLVSVAEPFSDMAGRTIGTFSKFIAAHSDSELEGMLQ